MTMTTIAIFSKQASARTAECKHRPRQGLKVSLTDHWTRTTCLEFYFQTPRATQTFSRAIQATSDELHVVATSADVSEFYGFPRPHGACSRSEQLGIPFALYVIATSSQVCAKELCLLCYKSLLIDYKYCANFLLHAIAYFLPDFDRIPWIFQEVSSYQQFFPQVVNSTRPSMTLIAKAPELIRWHSLLFFFRIRAPSLFFFRRCYFRSHCCVYLFIHICLCMWLFVYSLISYYETVMMMCISSRKVLIRLVSVV